MAVNKLFISKELTAKMPRMLAICPMSQFANGEVNRSSKALGEQGKTSLHLGRLICQKPYQQQIFQFQGPS
jgi:hypothetical protein